MVNDNQPLSPEEAAGIFGALPDFGQDIGDPEADGDSSLQEDASTESDEAEDDESGEQGDFADDSEDEGESDEGLEDEEDEEGSPEPEYVTVKVDGEEIQVTLEEALAGYSRTQDYTRKTQAAAAKDRALDAELAQTRAERQELAQQLAFLGQQLQQKAPQMPTGNDPAEWGEYNRAKADQEEVAKAYAKLQADMVADDQKLIAREAERLVEVMPEWKDPAKGREAREALIAYGVSQNLSREEVLALRDHRHILLLDKARRFDELQAKSAELRTTAKKSRTLKPGKSSARKGTKKGPSKRQRDAARKRLSQATGLGALNAGASIILQELGDQLE